MKCLQVLDTLSQSVKTKTIQNVPYNSGKDNELRSMNTFFIVYVTLGKSTGFLGAYEMHAFPG